MALPSNVGHGAEGIITLSNSNTGHLVHGQDGGFALGQVVHQLRILSGIDETDKGGSFTHEVRLMNSDSSVQHGGTHLWRMAREKEN